MADSGLGPTGRALGFIKLGEGGGGRQRRKLQDADYSLVTGRGGGVALTISRPFFSKSSPFLVSPMRR